MNTHRPTWIFAAVFSFVAMIALASCDPAPVEHDKPVEQQTPAPVHGARFLIIEPKGDTIVLQTIDASVLKYSRYQMMPVLNYVALQDSLQFTLFHSWTGIIGKYTRDSTASGSIRISNRSYAIDSGTIDIRQYDLSAHELTASFDLRFKQHPDSADVYRVIGEFNRVDFAADEHLVSPAVTYDASMPYQLSANFPALILHDNTLDLDAQMTMQQGECRAVAVDVTHDVTINIKDPALGIFHNADGTTWIRTISSHPRHPRCEGDYTELKPLATDSLVVTEFDPVKRNIKGYCTIGSLRHDFNFTCWRVKY